MKEQSPKGILSVVSDTWDFWTLVTEYLPQLKSDILAREGTLVIRPDSGDPVKILTGYTVVEDEKEKTFEMQSEAKSYAASLNVEAYQWNGRFYDIDTDAELMPCEIKGLIECLWDIFGGSITETGHKLLDDHIGAIYGDAITLKRQRAILQRLMNKGFASKVVLGIGSYSYQYVTRDTHGSAVKATSVVKNGERIAIFKDPKTDTKKKSAKGLLKVEYSGDELILIDDVSETEENKGLLNTVFENGKLIKSTTLAEIRQRISNQI